MKVDRKRLLTDVEVGSGIFIRAELDGGWGSYDLVELDSESVHKWLKEQSKDSLIISCMLILGHGNGH